MAWSSRYGHSHNFIQINTCQDNNMFYEYITVESDINKAKSIADAIKKKISRDFYELVELCLLSDDSTRADDIYRLIILGFSVGPSARTYLAYPAIQHVMKLEKNVWNEYHHYLGFLRFEELQDKTLFARFRPHNNIVSKVIPHFADRFPEENIMIVDVTRHIVAVSSKGRIAYAITDTDFDKITLPTSANEQLLQNLWRCFVDSVAINERSNPKLQQQLMPLRFREFATEFLK